MNSDLMDKIGDIFDEIGAKNEEKGEKSAKNDEKSAENSTFSVEKGDNSLAEPSELSENDTFMSDICQDIITADNNFSGYDASFMYLYASGFSKRMAVMKAYPEYSELSGDADRERFVASRSKDVLYKKHGAAIVAKIRESTKRSELQNDALVDRVLDGIADDLETSDDDRSKNVMRKIVLDFVLKNKEVNKKTEEKRGDNYVILGNMYKNNDDEKAINVIDTDAVDVGEEVASK